MTTENEPARPEAQSLTSGSVIRVRMAGPGRRRIWFVRIACIVAIALFAVTSAMIYFGWLEEKEPVAVIAVKGNATVAEAKVMLSGAGLPTPLTRTFAEGTGYRLRFHVLPGVYRLEIFSGTHLLYSNDRVTVDRATLEIDPFSVPTPTTTPASTSAPTRPA